MHAPWSLHHTVTIIILSPLNHQASLEESGSYNAKNMIVINVVLVNVKTLLVFCIMSPSCVSTLALPHHACYAGAGEEENTLERQS